MHLGLIADEYPPGPHGGVGSFTRDLAEGLVGYGFRVTVFVAETGSGRYWWDKERADLKGVHVIPVRMESPDWMRWRPGTIWQRLKLRRAVQRAHREESFDVIECMDNGGLFPFGGFSGPRNVVRLHGSTFFFDYALNSATGDPWTHWLEKLTLKKAGYLVGVSRYIAQKELELGGINRTPGTVIYNAVDTTYFSPSADVPTEQGLIVFANSIHSRKGVRELCQAMNWLCENRPEARLVIIGKHISTGKKGQPLWEELIEEVAPQYRERITFTGWLDKRNELLNWLRRANVCCYPSKLEGFGIAPLEAMAVGKATVFSKVGPGPEVIEDGVSGLLCDPEDPKDIAAKLEMVLSDQALAETMGQSGRQRAIELFDKTDWITRNARFYESLI